MSTRESQGKLYEAVSLLPQQNAQQLAEISSSIVKMLLQLSQGGPIPVAGIHTDPAAAWNHTLQPPPPIMYPRQPTQHQQKGGAYYGSMPPTTHQMVPGMSPHKQFGVQQNKKIRDNELLKQQQAQQRQIGNAPGRRTTKATRRRSRSMDERRKRSVEPA